MSNLVTHAGLMRDLKMIKNQTPDPFPTAGRGNSNLARESRIEII